jgi:hypothetical protein
MRIADEVSTLECCFDSSNEGIIDMFNLAKGTVEIAILSLETDGKPQQPCSGGAYFRNIF